jgi:hypothetical protein
MAPMGVSPPIGLTNHGGVEALGLLCARCGGLIIFNPSSDLSRGTDGPPAGARPELSARSEDLGKPAQTAPSVPGVTPNTTGNNLAVPSSRTHVRSDGSACQAMP